MSELSSEAAGFVHHYVRSSDELEVLLLLRRSGRPWTAAELGGVLSRPATATADDLEALSRRGLLDGAGAEYRFRRDRPDLDAVIDEVAAHYRDSRRRLLSEIGAGAAKRLTKRIARPTFQDMG
jgi:hypothetical protein